MLEVKNVSKVYGEGYTKVIALNDVSLQVNKGDFIAVMGPSGSGKSTLLNVIGGLDLLSSGEVVLDGQRIDNLCGEIARRDTGAFSQHHGNVAGEVA